LRLAAGQIPKAGKKDSGSSGATLSTAAPTFGGAKMDDGTVSRSSLPEHGSDAAFGGLTSSIARLKSEIASLRAYARIWESHDRRKQHVEKMMEAGLLRREQVYGE
jgi:hypothetical protein